MKINLIGMILNNCGRGAFDGAILDDDGKPLPAADSLDYMIMEYAKVRNGGTSTIVTISREVLRDYKPCPPPPTNSSARTPTTSAIANLQRPKQAAQHFKIGVST